MVIKNETKKIILSDTAIQAKTFKQKALGLLAEKKGTAMIFQTRFGIHTFCMKYPIDVLVLDKENKVTAYKQNMKANTIYFWNPLYKSLIELPHGIINATNTQLGDQISSDS